MERNYVIGKTLDHALKKYSHKLDIPSNIVHLPNPLNLNSSVLERKVIFGILASKIKQSDRELTTSESKCLKWLKRMYPNLLQYRHFTISIQITELEKSHLLIKINEYYKETENPREPKLRNIYRLFTF
jgi:hypothetical protein